MLPTFITDKQGQIAEVCRAHHVARLSVLPPLSKQIVELQQS